MKDRPWIRPRLIGSSQMVTCVQPTWAGVGVLDEGVGQWRYGFRRVRQDYRQPKLLISMPTTS
eukprot:10882972-Lingulodinium_polyedra.AAC.1